MSKKRRVRRIVRKDQSTIIQDKIFFRKYLSLISILIGSFIGLVLWLTFFRCKNDHCINSYFPIPYMGIAAFNTWIIAIYLFRSK